MNKYLFIIALLLTPSFLSAETIEGKVVGVHDGDTITLLTGNEIQHRIRLSEIDAPETSQAFGTQAKKQLSKKIFGKMVGVEYQGKDRYGRIIGKIYLGKIGKRWINKEMVVEGFAWHYKQYSTDMKLAQAESIARVNRRGLWADNNPTPPWEFRRKPKANNTIQENTARSHVQKPLNPSYQLNTASRTRYPISTRRQSSLYPTSSTGMISRTISMPFR